MYDSYPPFRDAHGNRPRVISDPQRPTLSLSRCATATPTERGLAVATARRCLICASLRATEAPMAETRKLAAILCSDVVGFSRLAGADEDRILARLRALRSDLIDPTIAVHNGRVVKRTGDGAIVEFRSVVDAVRCAIEVQNAMVERNAGVPEDRRIVFRIGIHLGDVVEESDGDLMGDGVNIAARLEGIAEPGAICLSEDAFRQVRGGSTWRSRISGRRNSRTSQGRSAPIRCKSVCRRWQSRRGRRRSRLGRRSVSRSRRSSLGSSPSWQSRAALGVSFNVNANIPAAAHLSIVVLPFTNLSNDPAQDYFADGVTENLTTDLSRIRDSFVIARNTAYAFKGKSVDAREIGKELGVRYVLEGSVQRDQNRVRVNAQLIDAERERISGPSVSRRTSPICSSCRIKSWRGSPTRWVMN